MSELFFTLYIPPCPAFSGRVMASKRMFSFKLADAIFTSPLHPSLFGIIFPFQLCPKPKKQKQKHESDLFYLEIRPFQKRISYYMEPIFTCEYTGKSSLNFFQALESENLESEKTQKLFPDVLKPRVLRACHFREFFNFFFPPYLHLSFAFIPFFSKSTSCFPFDCFLLCVCVALAFITCLLIYTPPFFHIRHTRLRYSALLYCRGGRTTRTTGRPHF